MIEPVTVPISDRTRVGQACQLSSRLAREIGFASEDERRLVLVVTELATNILRHAVNGFLVVQALTEAAAMGIEVVSVDTGPGMADAGSQLEDGISTDGGLGSGLGTARRLSDEFFIDSQPGRGTIVVARTWLDHAAGGRPRWSLAGGLTLAAPGEVVSGDAWTCVSTGDRATIMVADGLGHGPNAAEASRVAVALLREQPDAEPGELLHRVHRGLRGTRGAAVAIAQLERTARLVRFAGLGNVGGVICRSGRQTALLSQFGTAGQEAKTIRELPYPWTPGAAIVLRSDGVSSRWTANAASGAESLHPTVLAATLIRALRNQVDDATVAVLASSRDAT
jgi:anti-sigma regulatory factor (Ser/Thr protein kinase)